MKSFIEGEKACSTAFKYYELENVLLDSGAFSFLNGVGVKDNYIKRYIEFINRHNIKYFFELDLYNIIGIEKTEKLRNELEYFTNMKVIPVWHKSLGVDYWEKLVNEYNYIAIGGVASKTIKPKEYHLVKHLVDYAYSKGVKVHGLGFTATKTLHNYKFYSVDSTSWLTQAVRGQQVCSFNGYYIQARKIESDKKLNLKKLEMHNLSEWIKYQKYMERL